MRNNLKIGVTSVTFSENLSLIKEMEKYRFAELRKNRFKYPLSGSELITFLKNLDGSIIGREIIDEKILKSAPKIKVLSKFGVGLDNIDFEACKKHDVEVVYSEGINKRSVAEQTLAFMIFLMRNLYRTSNRLKKGVWEKNGGYQLTGKKIGIIGVGNVGKDVVDLLKPFKCEILVNDIIDQRKYYRDNRLTECSKTQIFTESDIVTIHTPLTDLTRNMVGRSVLKKMKNSSFLINTARGAIINQELENFICTPHIGGNAREAVEEMGRCAIKNLVNFFNLK